MATTREINYPTSDGRPMAETEQHARDMIDVIQTLCDHFAADPGAYVWGNMMLFYEEGNPRKHIAPDVFFVRGVPKTPPRLYYLVWKEGKSPDVVIEITSKTTRREDQKKKLILYRDVLRVPEYFQFDPTEDYLKPPMQGYRLIEGQYVPIKPIEGRLPSAELGLHLERDGLELRLYDPINGHRLPTRGERAAAQREAEARQREAEARQHEAEAQQREAEARQREAEVRQREAEANRQQAETRAQRVEAENERLRREMEELRRKLSGES